MEDLKFRAWYKGDLIQGKYMPFYTIENEGVVRFEWNDDDAEHPFTYEIGIILADDDWIVEQYTRLKDKNGVDLYVGDIVATPDDYYTYGMAAGLIREIYFKDGCLRLKPLINSHLQRGYLIEDMDNFEIVGNIHENKEMLK